MATFLLRVIIDRLTSLFYKNSRGNISGSHFKEKYNHKYSQRIRAVDSCLLLIPLSDLLEVQQLAILLSGRTESSEKLKISLCTPSFWITLKYSFILKAGFGHWVSCLA